MLKKSGGSQKDPDVKKKIGGFQKENLESPPKNPDANKDKFRGSLKDLDVKKIRRFSKRSGYQKNPEVPPQKSGRLQRKIRRFSKRSER